MSHSKKYTKDKKDIGRKEAYNRAIEHTFHPGDQINGYKYISEYPFSMFSHKLK